MIISAIIIVEMIKFRKLNNIKVKPIRTPDDENTRPPRGEKLISTAYANIGLIGKKKTGKSSCIATMLKAFCGPKTKVHIFCSTVLIDPTYIALGEWMDSKGIEYYPSTSLKSDDGFDLIEDILKIDEDMFKEDEGTDEKGEVQLKLLDLDPKPKERKPRKSKYKEINRLFVFDDISNELNSTSLRRLMKMHRHIRSKILLSTQWLNDIPPQSISQLDYTFLFKNIIPDKLTEAHKKLDLSLDLNVFINMYEDITKDKKLFNFLYITRFEEYRKNFNELIIIEGQ